MLILNCDVVVLSVCILGVLFFYVLNSVENVLLVVVFQDGSWQQQWFFLVVVLLVLGFVVLVEEMLLEVWQCLFIGLWVLLVLFWGFVWLDKEFVLFGDFMLVLCQWMCENGIVLEVDGNELEDYFGIVLFLVVWLCEMEQDVLFVQLLVWYLLLWFGCFLSVFVDYVVYFFYQVLGQLVQVILVQWQENLLIVVV